MTSMKSRLAVLAVASAISMGAYAAAITGAGSSWVYPLVAKWSAEYLKLTGVQVNYQSIGSGGGIAQIKAGTVAFGASDKPLTPAELAQSKLDPVSDRDRRRGLGLQCPRPQGGRTDRQRSGGRPTSIMGKVTKWNDPAIAKLNPACQASGHGYHRRASFGRLGHDLHVRRLFVQGQPGVEGEDRRQTRRSTGRPASAARATRASPSYVQRIKGSVGYVEYAYILENKLDYARMINSAGKTVSPSLEGFQAAAANVDFTKAEDFYVILTDQPGAESWPISGCTWQILRKNAAKADNEAVTKFFLWGFEHGQDIAKSIDFGPLPPSTVSAIKAYWKKNLGI